MQFSMPHLEDSDSDSELPEGLMFGTSNEAPPTRQDALVDKHIRDIVMSMDGDDEREAVKRQIASAPVVAVSDISAALAKGSRPSPQLRSLMAPGADSFLASIHMSVSSASSMGALSLGYSSSSTCLHDEPEKRVCEITEKPPCLHNQWDRMSKKKHSITLRCKKCQAYWKTKLDFFSKCPAFYAGKCELGDKCPYPHIYSKAAEKHQLLKSKLHEDASASPGRLSMLDTGAADQPAVQQPQQTTQQQPQSVQMTNQQQHQHQHHQQQQQQPHPQPQPNQPQAQQQQPVQMQSVPMVAYQMQPMSFAPTPQPGQPMILAVAPQSAGTQLLTTYSVQTVVQSVPNQAQILQAMPYQAVQSAPQPSCTVVVRQ